MKNCTWLIAVAFITLVPKINVATIQIWSLLIAHKRCLCPYLYNQFWAYLCAENIWWGAFNQVNMVQGMKVPQTICRGEILTCKSKPFPWRFSVFFLLRLLRLDCWQYHIRNSKLHHCLAHLNCRRKQQIAHFSCRQPKQDKQGYRVDVNRPLQAAMGQQIICPVTISPHYPSKPKYPVWVQILY